MLRNGFPCGDILLRVGAAMLAMPGLGWAAGGARADTGPAMTID